MKKTSDLLDLVEGGYIPIKVVVRVYPTGPEIYIARFNGWSWVVRNPVVFKTIEEAQAEIDRSCALNPLYINQKDF